VASIQAVPAGVKIIEAQQRETRFSLVGFRPLAFTGPGSTIH
jgi:hypothetical protein